MVSFTGAPPKFAATTLVSRMVADVVAPAPRLPVTVSLISKATSRPSFNRKLRPRLVIELKPVPLRFAIPGPVHPKPEVPTAQRAPADAGTDTRHTAANIAANAHTGALNQCFMDPPPVDLPAAYFALVMWVAYALA